MIRLSVAIILLLCAPAHAAELMMFAAASLTDCLKEIGREYQSKTGDIIGFNFAASSFLARQIEEGAEADVYFSADEAKMDALEKKGLLAPNTRKSLLSNSLVIVVPVGSSARMDSAGGLTNSAIERIALADPKTVPAGIYARKYLQKVQLWPSLRNKIVPLDNVRSALAAVASGDVDAGIVYETDAAISINVKIAYRVSKGESPAISYPAAVLQTSPNPAEAARFMAYLESADARRVFQKFGFVVLK